MSALTRLLPVPSDRMGTIWNLLALEDSCVLEYGPSGTTHFGIGTEGDLGLQTRGRCFVTHMDESDVVMGDTSRLERAVHEIDSDCRPEHLFIVGSSVSATIGTDLKGISYYLAESCKAKLHVFDSGGFDGDYLLGTEAVYKMLGELVSELPPPSDSKEKKNGRRLKYNILGASPDHYRVRSDINEIERMMREALDCELSQVYVSGGRLADLPLSLEADFNLLIRNEALPLAEAMQEKAGLPYFAVCPYGYQGSLDMLKRIADAFELKMDPGFASDAAKKQNEIAMLPFFLRNLQQPLYVHSIGADFLNKGLAQAVSETGIAMGRQLLTQAPEEERLAFIRGLKGALVFADTQSLRLLPPGNMKVTCAFPWFKHSIIAEHLPLMGIRGMDYIAEKINDYISERSSL